jgi:hydroxymethylpyrimidine kinase/phosphomethylpyrimidine kinase
VITPNLPEAATLAGASAPADMEGMERLAAMLSGQGARAVLVKGGHLSGATAQDVLFSQGQVTRFSVPRVDTQNTHGTGCTLSSAIAAHLARGLLLEEAVRAAKDYLTRALGESDRLDVGHGHGPVHHFASLWR